jgi:hypothetical protein
MNVVVISITDEFGEAMLTKVFSSNEKADAWVREYVKKHWSSVTDEQIPEDLSDAAYEYFYGGFENHNENLIREECVVDDEGEDQDDDGRTVVATMPNEEEAE